MLFMVREKQQEQLDCSRPPKSVKGWPLIISPIRGRSLLLSRREGNGQKFHDDLSLPKSIELVKPTCSYKKNMHECFFSRSTCN